MNEIQIGDLVRFTKSECLFYGIDYNKPFRLVGHINSLDCVDLRNHPEWRGRWCSTYRLEKVVEKGQLKLPFKGRW